MVKPFDNDYDVIDAILNEVYRARAKHPNWPTDRIHGAAIVAEEAGETIKAALDEVYFGHPAFETNREAIQTAATVVRLLTGR